MMIKRLAGLVLLGVLVIGSAGAFAEDIWEMENRAGGKITLTSQICEVDGEQHKNFFFAHAFSPAGEFAIGCWTVAHDKAGHIRIIWAVEPVRTIDYPVANFSRIKPGAAKNDGKRI